MTTIKEYIEKKTGRTTYWFSHYCGKDESGKRKMVTKRGFETLEDAELALATLKVALRKGTYQEKQKVTFSKVYEAWRIGYKNTVRPVTVDRTEQQFEKHILPRFGNKEITSITLRECQEAVNEWSTFYRNFKVLKSCVQRVLDYAVQSNYRNDNPMRFVQMPRIQATEDELLNGKPENFYNTHELSAFLKTLKENFSYRHYAIFHTLSYSGLRKGEMMALMWSDIDFEKGLIRVSRNMIYLDGKVQISPPKTKNSIRTISMDEHSMNVLKHWRTQQSLELFELGIRVDSKKQWVFNRINKKVQNVPLYHKYTDTVIEKVLGMNPALPEITTHGFRHTHASILVEAGANAKEIQSRLGHTSIQTTLDTYGHMTERAMENTGVKFAKQMLVR
ncbi:site-specific integrase [Jeotgalibaca caeni]|uniref:site-specific integrase n=1 Tax=Jeotgalibaca caeni TaxID=3028623 RepID=UPI00237EB465|nr:site-specific integrase [Jeotgalibaca caeni]MDE1548129.1 site-specific integrase [Jeotgalibaca caeni]